MQNIISNLNSNSKIPPSELGFVCKPELPPHINILFRARPPLPFLNKKIKSNTRFYTGVFDKGNSLNILDLFDKPNNNNNNNNNFDNFKIEESKYIKKLKNIIIKNENNKQLNKERIKKWNPKNNQNSTNDPYKTIFVYRLEKNIDEKTLKKEFEKYGRIKKIRIIKDFNGKNRGYGFIEFAHTSDFKAVLKDKKNYHHIKINGKTVHVDYERGRTDKYFIPRKFGGGIGTTREIPLWLERQLDEVKKKFPELVVKKKKKKESEREKGEILDEDEKNNEENNNNNENKNKDKKNEDNKEKNKDNEGNKNKDNGDNNKMEIEKGEIKDDVKNDNNEDKSKNNNNDDNKMEIEKGEINDDIKNDNNEDNNKNKKEENNNNKEENKNNNVENKNNNEDNKNNIEKNKNNNEDNKNNEENKNNNNEDNNKKDDNKMEIEKGEII